MGRVCIGNSHIFPGHVLDPWGGSPISLGDITEMVLMIMWKWLGVPVLGSVLELVSWGDGIKNETHGHGWIDCPGTSKCRVNELREGLLDHIWCGLCGCRVICQINGCDGENGCLWGHWIRLLLIGLRVTFCSFLYDGLVLPGGGGYPSYLKSRGVVLGGGHGCCEWEGEGMMWDNAMQCDGKLVR